MRTIPWALPCGPGWRAAAPPVTRASSLLAPRCDVCGLDYDFAHSGDGPAVFVILITGFIIVGAALLVEVRYQPPYWLHAVLWGSLAIILPLLLLRAFKGALIALQFRHKAEEGKLASD
jgi:uncharacterized protein (DUF983 family)